MVALRQARQARNRLLTVPIYGFRRCRNCPTLDEARFGRVLRVFEGRCCLAPKRRLEATYQANLDYLIHETGRSGVIKKSSFEIEMKDPAYIAVSKKSKHKGVVPRLEKALSDMRRDTR
jgi:hypothetical protein